MSAIVGGVGVQAHLLLLLGVELGDILLQVHVGGFAAFLLGDLAAVKEEQSWQFLYHRNAVPGLTVQNISSQFKLFQIGELRQFFDVKELCNLIGVSE